MKKHIEYKTTGTCSRAIIIDIEDGVITDCSFVGGCPGNTTGVASLVKGMKAEEVLKPQFAEKNVGQFTYTKTGAMTSDEIDAISGATITTNALVNGVNAGLECFKNELGGGVNE